MPENLMNKRSVIGLALACLTILGIFRGVERNCEAAIVYPAVPDAAGGRQAIFDFLQLTLHHPRTGIDKVLGSLNIDDLTIGAPYRQYSVALNDVASGQLLSAARIGTDWMYPVMHGNDAVALAMVIERPGQAPKFVGIGEIFSAETLKALQLAEQLPQVKNRDYEVRRLIVGFYGLVAVWLHAESDDIIIPVNSDYGLVNPWRPYTPDQIIRVLQPAAMKEVEEARQHPDLDRDVTSNEVQAPGAGPVHLVAQQSGKCLEAVGTPGQLIAATQQTCNDAPTQQWSFHAVVGGCQIVSWLDPHLCLNLRGATAAQGARVWLSDCSGTGTPGEIWNLQAAENGYNIIASHSEKCMDVSRGSTDDGAAILQYTCHGSRNQIWTMQPIAPANSGSDSAAPFATHRSP